MDAWLKLGRVAGVITLIVKRKIIGMIYSKCQNLNQIRAEKPLPPGCLMEPQAFPKTLDLI